jgi:uncharacterized membrane protein YjjP (DUF1212 family)
LNLENNTVSYSVSEEKHADKILRTSLDLAENILRCGGTVHRAEETVERICKAYGAVHVEVFSITSVIIASVRMENGEYAMQTRRIYGYQNNFTRLDRLNAISRDVCSQKITLDEAQVLIKSAKHAEPYHIAVIALAAMLISGSFAMFFGGTFLDAIASAVLGLIISLFSKFAPKMLNQMASNFILSFLNGSFAILFTMVGFGDNYDKIIIGTIMMLIPGIAFGTALRDLLGGDTLSGILQLIQALLLAVILAFGYILAIFCFGRFVA